MARPKPFGILFRSLIPDAVRRQGYKAFGTKGYFGEYFNQNIYEQAQEHVLGTETQVGVDDATIWYDDTAGLFKDKAGGTVTLVDYDRVAMITDTADQDIDFPVGKEIVFVPYDEVDLGGFDLNLLGEYSGELRAINGTINITGTGKGLRINGSATVDTTGMTGTVIANGIIITTNLSGSIHDHADNASGGNTLDTPTISDLTNSQHNHSNAAGGGDTLNSPTIVTPTIADASNVSEVNSIKDQGGISTSGLKCKQIAIGDWNMQGSPSVTIAHGLDYTKIKFVFATIRSDDDGTYTSIYLPDATGINQGWIASWNVTGTIILHRLSGGGFDSTSWNSTSFNRGWITVWYEA